MLLTIARVRLDIVNGTCDLETMPKTTGYEILLAKPAIISILDNQPFSFRQVKYVVRRSYPALEWIVPEFLYVPWWIIAIATHKF